jgi:hypothetical protein
MRPQGNIRLIEAIRDALGEAEAYVSGECAVECVRDAPRKEAEHLDEVGWHSAHDISSTRRDALDALNTGDAR